MSYEQRMQDDIEALTAERDQLRAQLETASNNARLYADKCEELESTVAGLRRALEEARSFVGRTVASAESMALNSRLVTALTASPADHERRIKSEALKEMARLFMATANSDLSYHNRDLAARFCNAAADELEAANGKT